ncbi:hypothetical protein [Flavobacterium sp.]|uniref:hypothetical protein n=1 Tax=Flavobacterium sp. TaxID=239 RepID=UPI0035B20152
MKKIIVALLLISLFSCQKKEVLLPQLDETIVADVKDHSPIYMFFETNGKDTLIDVNRSNSISSTNWLFNIDKRLPLKLVIPEIQKLQAKKEKSAHKSETAENYFTYMDKKKKTLAFLPLVEVEYVFDNPTLGMNTLYFKADGKMYFNKQQLSEQELEQYLNDLLIERESEIFIGYDKNLSFENYLKYRLKSKKIVIKKLGLSINYAKEFIY